MMSARTTVTGHLGSTPELRTTKNGKQVLTLDIAATDQQKNQAGQWEDSGSPLWIYATFWDKHASRLAKTLTKGDKVSVEGTLTIETYQARDGQTHKRLVLKRTRFLGVVPRTQQGPRAPTGDDFFFPEEPPF